MTSLLVLGRSLTSISVLKLTDQHLPHPLDEREREDIREKYSVGMI